MRLPVISVKAAYFVFCIIRIGIHIYSKEFDVLIVSSIDRIARNTKECIEIVNQLNELKIDIVFLRESVDTRTSVGRMIFHVFSSLAEYEREMIRSRIMSGLNRAREQGKKLGRKTKINE